MNKKLIKTIASITCGLGIVGSIPFATTCCECSTKKNNSLPESVYSFSDDGKTLLGFKEGVNLSQYEGVCDTMQIPARVTSIAELAFVNDAFAQEPSSAIPEFITKLTFAKGSQCFLIRLGAFAYWSTLTTVNLPNSLIKLDNSVFHKCSALTYVDFSNCTIFSSIAQEVFSYCLSLTSITLPSCLIEIGSDAFSGSNLSTITWNAWKGGIVSQSDSFSSLPENGTVFVKNPIDEVYDSQALLALLKTKGLPTAWTVA